MLYNNAPIKIKSVSYKINWCKLNNSPENSTHKMSININIMYIKITT